MSAPLPCPSCSAPNAPGQSQCHACGQPLEGPPSVERAPTVLIKRVMSGEVFAAVLNDASAEPETPPLSDALAAPAEPEEEDRRFLAVAADRLAQLAARAGRKFKPYPSGKIRRPSTPDAERVVARNLEAAVAAFRGHAYDEAIAHLLKAVAKDDGDPRSWLLLAEAYLRRERPYKAAVSFLRSLDLDLAHGKAWLGLARALREAGDPASALEATEHAVRIEPSSPEAWLDRGLLAEALDRPSEAIRSFNRVLDLRPDHRVAREHRDALQSAVLDDLQVLPPGERPVVASKPAATAEPSPEPTAPPADDWSEFEDLGKEREAAPSPRDAAAASETAMARPLRVPTYIEGLDPLLGGGVPWGHVVLLQGAPGTMKSSLGFSILLRNATEAGRHGLYISLEERASSLLRQMGSLGLPLAVKQGSLVVLDPRAAKGLLGTHDDWIPTFQKALATVKKERGLDLLVIDSLEALEVLAGFADRRREIFRLFEWLRDLDVTSFVITERPDFVIGGQVLQGRWDEDFLADGVLHLRQHLVTDLEVQRRLRVVKMRGTRHDSGYLALVLDEGRFRVTRAMSP